MGRKGTSFANYAVWGARASQCCAITADLVDTVTQVTVETPFPVANPAVAYFVRWNISCGTHVARIIIARWRTAPIDTC